MATDSSSSSASNTQLAEAYSDYKTLPSPSTVFINDRPLDDFFQDYTPDARQPILQRVNKNGLQSAITYYQSQFDYQDHLIAGRLVLYNLYGSTPSTFEDYLLLMRPLMRKWTTRLAQEYPGILDLKQDDPALIWKLQQAFYAANDLVKLDEPNQCWLFMWLHREELASAIDETRDLRHSYHSIQVFWKTYLTKQSFNGATIERPQWEFMRIACHEYGELTGNIDAALTETLRAYREMSEFHYVPASPTIFNAGMTVPQCSSCFLHTTFDTSQSIVRKFTNMALISKANGANGDSLTNLRSGTNIGNSGPSSGTGVVAQTIDAISRYHQDVRKELTEYEITEDVIDNITGEFDQGGRRKGATQLTLDIFHVDAVSHMEKADRKNTNSVKNIHLCMFMHDLFFQRVTQDERWSLFCPTDAPELTRTHGKEWEKWYVFYEAAGLARYQMKARSLHEKLAKLRLISGMPFLVNGDCINRKTNQSNIGNGHIATLNLCLEVALVSDDDRTPSCNLSATCIPTFIDESKEEPVYDYVRYGRAVRSQARNLNKIIERNYYPIPEILFSNQEAAPIGIGGMGFDDALNIFKIPFESPEAIEFARKLGACAYYNAILESMLIAKERGYPYQKFQGSPFSRGIFQFDMWIAEAAEKGETLPPPPEPSEWGQVGSWEWLKSEVMTYGVANSQLTTSQPTASCAQIADFTEAYDKASRNLFVRKVMAGEFITVGQRLQHDLRAIGCWNEKTIAFIRHYDGSVQKIHEIFPGVDDDTKRELLRIEKQYKTAFEIKQSSVLRQAAVRGMFLDGSSSTSLSWVQGSDEEEETDPLYVKIMQADMLAYKLGLKTIIYYTRSQPVRNAAKFTLEMSKEELYKPLPVAAVEVQVTVKDTQEASGVKFCLRENPECLACS